MDRAADAGFTQALAGESFFGPVYFVRQSEPHMRIAAPIEPSAGEVIGVLSAEVSLKYIWDVIANIRVGQTGYAYVVSPQGDLIAHPDISLALRKQNLNHLDHVRAILAGAAAPAQHQNLQGEDVFATAATIPDLAWTVVVERLTKEAYAPLYTSLIRLALLLLLGLGMAGLASVMINRRVVRPIETLRLGADKLGAGELHHRLCLQTGDELQVLADAFNRMAEQLEVSRAELEYKVEARTRELARSVADLEIVSQHKSRFLAHMSHEMRTPLHAIVGYTQSILDHIYGDIPQEVREPLDRVQRSSNHLLKLITDILDISRIEAGRYELSIAEYSILSIVQTVMIAVENLAAAKHLTVRMTAASDLPIGKGDERRLTQVLLNLVGNAITYTESGEIGIEASASEGLFTIRVTDAGPGIAPEDQQRIFKTFEQAHASAKRAQSGAGLGLTISKTIIELHGGQMGVASSLGQGSTFWCTFPVRVESGQT